MKVKAKTYQQYDADFNLDVPAEAYGGWKEAELEISPEHTAVVSMHAWDCGTRAEFPGWHRAIEYIPRAQKIAAEIFPGLLSAVRQSPLKLYHVVGGGDYYHNLPGYLRAKQLQAEPVDRGRVDPDPVYNELHKYRQENVAFGSHNADDIKAGFEKLDFMPEARPIGEEGVAENADQLYALCKADDINHLIYAGFAINWCLLKSPGGMVDMSRHGLICSAIPEAVTAVENRESARAELAKEIGLWRVALAFGFVFPCDDFIAAIKDA